MEPNVKIGGFPLMDAAFYIFPHSVDHFLHLVESARFNL